MVSNPIGKKQLECKKNDFCDCTEDLSDVCLTCNEKRRIWLYSCVNTSWDELTANFHADMTTATTIDVVTFTDTSTWWATSWSWDFWDGTSSIDQNPTKLYALPWVYTVTLEVSDGTSTDTHIIIDYITVTL